MEIKYTAYLDDSGEPTDLGQRYSTIAAVIIPDKIVQQVEMAAQTLWDDYMSGTQKTEFHATEIESETGIFSNLNYGSIPMQTKFMQIIEKFDMPVFAITVDNNIIESGVGLPRISEGIDGKSLATNIIIGLISGIVHDFIEIGSCRIIADKGLFRGKGMGIIANALILLGKPVGQKADGLFQKIGVAPQETLKDFLIDEKVEEKDSFDFTGLQLADHVARYVFKYSKIPDINDARYDELCRIGLIDATQNQIFKNNKMFQGITIRMRIPKVKKTEPRLETSSGRRATLSDIEKVVPLFEEHLKQKLTWEGICPSCKSKLFWGIPSAEYSESAAKGQVILCGPKFREKNYCPKCKTMLFTQKEIMEKWSGFGE